ncbi:MAG: DUF2520 domain-containing protein [Planctomycetes bacterium]|nr:DUF2520 domain-containing protein [Planctomycetota bacterium]
MTTVSIIGRGRVGKVLSLVHQQCGDSIVENGEWVIFAVPDDQLANVVEEYSKSAAMASAKFCAHVSGLYDHTILQPLANAGAEIAALHPIMQFGSATSDIENLAKSFVSYSGQDSALQLATAVVQCWQGKLIELKPGSDRRQYHLALSLVSNHVTGLLAWANELLLPILGDESAIIIKQMAARAVEVADGEDPMNSLTGPVARGDLKTIAQHLQSLDVEQARRYAGLLLNLQTLVAERSE